MGLWDSILYYLSNKNTKSKGNVVKIKFDSNNRVLSNGKYVKPGYKFYDRKSKQNFVVNNNGVAVAQRVKNNNFVDRSTNDRNIANKQKYGVANIQKNYQLNRLYRSIDPGAAISFGDAIKQWINYHTYNTEKPKATAADQAFFNRQIGMPRDYNYMPLTNVRFSGDLNNDGSLKWPNKEYTGIDNSAKKQILQRILDGDLNPSGKWQTAKEGRMFTGPNNNTSATSQLKDFSYRENGNSGIYDIFDTYDFNSYASGLNRDPGKEIEVRDTIWGPNAKPNLYNPSFTVSRFYNSGKDIHIKPSKRGTFTKASKQRGMSVQRFANKVLRNPGNYSAAMRKKANFARNAAKWNR